jgi:hypothetical protein
MDKHYCSKCGFELNDRDMCGFTEQTTCFKCGYSATEDTRIAWYQFLLIPLLALIYWVAIEFTHPL